MSAAQPPAADISRAYRFKVASGQNQVVIFGLPNVLDNSSIRVEGRGNATIQDVTGFSGNRSTRSLQRPPKLEELEDEKEEVKLSLDRYLESRTEVKPTSESLSSNVLPLVDDYNSASEKYDKKALERKRLALSNSVTVDRQRLMKATVGVFAEAETEVELLLKYAVTGASWSALYDIRANTETKESPVEIVYKASITQSTGEDWTDIPVTLETATPTFGLSLPVLGTWNLSVYKPPPPLPHSEYKKSKSLKPGAARFLRSRKASAEEESEEDDDMGFGTVRRGAFASVTSQGNVNATFRVPGLISIPSDGVSHNVTIVSLKPEARLAWMTVPSVDTKVHLTTRITNSSEYTLLPGSSSVYVDGSFISKSSVPLVSPQESFTCALGLDPSIRITNPPPRGILTKTSSTSYTQRISVYNTKSMPIDNVKVLARIPVSQDAQITVKLISPSLPSPSSASQSGTGGSVTSPSTSSIKDFASKIGNGAKQATKVAEGAHVGKDGKVQWVCALEAQMKVDLTLHWEVSAAKEVVVIGL
ncbi:hypothetical protein FA13DRAFT_1756801 [Coprinellus micaceus]|uniref:Mucoidy inhibitor A n=1 Tax=Coprinellus micaceus TaxID=71717 RepID=A0A4Y7SRM8_COPMI|nr:hypothetical protein FA13DRAFT_1756801 [Coprinellus micaceus]